jgi:PAS domain S-box-containing protein
MKIPAEVQSVMGLFSRLSRGRLAVVTSVALVLIPTCFGLAYLLSVTLATNHAIEQQIVAAAARDTLVLSGYDRAIRLYEIAQRAYSSPEKRDSLRPAFDALMAGLRAFGTEYVTHVSTLPSEDRAHHLEPFGRLWVIFEDLAEKSSRAFAEGPGTRAGGRSRSRSDRGSASFLDDPNIYFGKVRANLDELLRAELSEDVKTMSRLRREIDVISYRGFIIAFFLFGVGAVLTVALARQGRRSEAGRRRYETLLAASLNPIEIVSIGGTILYVNPALERWIGKPSGDLLGQFIFDGVECVSHREQGTELWSQVQAGLNALQAWSGEIELKRKDAGSTGTLLIISPVLGANGKVVEAIGIHHDVTERRELARKFAESQEKYQSIVESSLDGIVVIQDGKIVFVNESSAKIFGYGSPEEMKDVSFVDTVAPSNRFLVLDNYDRKPIGDDVFRNFEMKGLSKQGTVVDLEVNAKRVAWNGKPAVQASFRDITKRKALEREQALWLWEQETMSTIDRQLVSSVNLQTLLDAISYHAKALTRADWSGVMMLDLDAQVARWRSMTGNRVPMPAEPMLIEAGQVESVSSKDRVVMNIGTRNELPPDQLMPFERESIVSAARYPLLVEKEIRGQLVVGYRRNHEFTARELRLLASLAEKSSIALANANLYENLLSRERELEMLTGARVQAQEDERRRIAREIHDSLGQMLTAIKFNVEILEDAADLQSDEDRRRIADIKSLLDNAMAEAREISYNLMPSVLVDFGLVPALQYLGEQFSKRNELSVKVHTTGVEGRLDSSIEVGLYRIAQEALHNVAKHADAREVSVQLIGDTETIRLVIEDDGKGFNVSRSERNSGKPRGMGLVGMRERAASFNGQFVLESRPGRGTEIIVEVPRVTSESHG